MAHSHTLDELLARWDEAHSKGLDLSAEELCAALQETGCAASPAPDVLARLREQIRGLKEVDGLLRTQSWSRDRARADVELNEAVPVIEQRYAIQSHLAKGGLGTVFIAEDQELRR